ncbi:MAG: hypothetical protein MEQ07_07405 [Aquimonas sp.]|nr:hypothetical protein [Aquimonas sp.]
MSRRFKSGTEVNTPRAREHRHLCICDARRTVRGVTAGTKYALWRPPCDNPRLFQPPSKDSAMKLARFRRRRARLRRNFQSRSKL